MLHDTKLLLVGGAGKIGTAIARGLVASGKIPANHLVVTARHRAKIDRFGVESVGTSLDNAAAYDDLGHPVVLLSVHPDEVDTALADLGRSNDFSSCPLVISVATGVRTADIEAAVPDSVPVIRTMPNLPARIGAAATVLTPGSAATDDHVAIAREIFETIGTSVVLDERHLDAATGLSGCGPAYVFQIIEGLSHGGVQQGLPREAALILAAQTVLGAARLVLETGSHPAVLRDEVTTPGGCTIAALSRLERDGLKSALIEAVAAATDKARDLGRTVHEG